MAKQVIHVGLAVATDGFYPGKANIVSLAASLGQVGQFAINIRPKDGKYGESPFWVKHLTEWEEFKKEPVALNEAMIKFRTWLHQWQGNLIACTSSIDFWHLLSAMFDTGKDCPFGSHPLDTNSYYAGMEGRKTPIRIMAAIRPIEVAHQRWEIVTKGTIPTFGPEKKGPPKLKSVLSQAYRTIQPQPATAWHGDIPQVATPARPPDRPMTNRRFTTGEVAEMLNAHNEQLRSLQQQQAMAQQNAVPPQSFADLYRQQGLRQSTLIGRGSDGGWDIMEPPEPEE